MKRILMFYAVLVAFIISGCTGKEEKVVINVLTLNVRYDNPDDSINAWTYRSEKVFDFLDSEKPDVVGMQEVLWHQYEYLDSVLTDYSSVGAGRDDGVRGGELNPVFFRKERFDLARTLTFWLSETPEIPGSKAWGASLPRIVTWLELVDKENHQHIFFFNTHFAHDSDSARIMSSALLLREVKKIAEGFPFIITGDFNMLPDSKGYAILTGPDESVPLLKDTYFISKKKPYGPSYTFNGFSDRQGKGRIDYIFVKDGIEVSEHQTIIKKENGMYLSDHWPVETVLFLKKKMKQTK